MDGRRERGAMKRFKLYPADWMKSNFQATAKPKGLKNISLSDSVDPKSGCI